MKINFYKHKKKFEKNLLNIVSIFIVFKLSAILLVILFYSCNKPQDQLVLDEEFLTVADLLKYCQGSCDNMYDWESSTVLVKGHILNFNNDSIRLDYYSKSKFYLQDIRNGMFIEIRIDENKDPIFEKIWPADHKNLFFIKGTAEPVIATNDGECSKGVVVSLIHPDHINFE